MNAIRAEYLLLALALLAYAAGTYVSFSDVTGRSSFPASVLTGLLNFGSAALAGVLVVRASTVSHLPVFGQVEALSWYGLAVAGGFAFLQMRHHPRGLGATVFPVLFIAALIAFPGVVGEPENVQRSGLWLTLHVLTAFVGYGLFTLESLLAVNYLIQDRNLKRKQLGRVFQRLPSLDVLDRLMGELIGTAFCIFTASIGFGIVLAHQYQWGSRWLTDPKIAATVLTWGVYALLFYMRTVRQSRGRTLALIALVGFGFVLFSFLGVHMVADSIHDFMSSGLNAG